MEPVLDKNKNIFNVEINREYYNNYSIFKQQYINELNFIEDKKILHILKCNYLHYGLVTNDMIVKKENNHIIDSDDKVEFLYKNPHMIDFNKDILNPEILFEKVNKFIHITTKFLNLVNENYDKIMSYDVQILQLLASLKIKSLPLYLQNFITFNNIRIFLNTLFFEYYQDINYINNRLLQIKYDYFIMENDILTLNKKIISLLDSYNEDKIFVLILDDKKVNFKVINGCFDIENLICLIEEKLHKLNNLDC